MSAVLSYLPGNIVCHSWVQDDQDDQNDLDDQKLSSSSGKCGVLVFGVTGSGKSSICKLLTGNKDIQTSGGHASVQKESSLYQSNHPNYSNLFFIDTQGTQDNNRKYNDKDILKNVLKYIHFENITELKIIWCVSGETNTRSGPFTDQAEFINGLIIKNDDCKSNGLDNDNDNNDNGINQILSVWKSVLIIKKEGNPTGAFADLAGVVAAANQCGAKYGKQPDRHLFGFKCLSWKDYCSSDEYKMFLQTADFVPSNFGYLQPDAAREQIYSKLSALPSFKLRFKHETCVKCGAKGDSRYINKTCHTKSENVHATSVSHKHIGGIKKFHPLNLGCLAWLEHIHPGYLRKNHIGSIVKRHLGKVKKVSVSRIATFCFMLSTSEWLFWSSKDWCWYDCCNKYKGALGCTPFYSCCDQHVSATQCSEPSVPFRWSCCDELEGEEGCESIIKKTIEAYNCCGKPKGEQGCREKWNCCGSSGGRGCVSYYPCCDRPEYLNGVNGRKSTGCREICSNCKVSWGSGPGCLQPQITGRGNIDIKKQKEYQKNNKLKIQRNKNKKKNKKINNKLNKLNKWDKSKNKNKNKNEKTKRNKIRKLNKKLKEIKKLEEKQKNGEILNDQQVTKLKTKKNLIAELKKVK